MTRTLHTSAFSKIRLALIGLGAVMLALPAVGDDRPTATSSWAPGRGTLTRTYTPAADHGSRGSGHRSSRGHAYGEYSSRGYGYGGYGSSGHGYGYGHSSYGYSRHGGYGYSSGYAYPYSGSSHYSYGYPYSYSHSYPYYGGSYGGYRAPYGSAYSGGYSGYGLSFGFGSGYGRAYDGYDDGYSNVRTFVRSGPAYRSPPRLVYDYSAPDTSPSGRADSGDLGRSAGWDALAEGNNRRALSRFADGAIADRSDSVVRVGYALAAALSGDDQRAVWAMRRAMRIDAPGTHYAPIDETLKASIVALIDRYRQQGEQYPENTDGWFMAAALAYVLHDEQGAAESIRLAREAGDTQTSATSLEAAIRATLEDE